MTNEPIDHVGDTRAQNEQLSMRENSIAESRQHDTTASPIEPFPRSRLRFCGFFFGDRCLFIRFFEFGVGHLLEDDLDFGS